MSYERNGWFPDLSNLWNNPTSFPHPPQEQSPPSFDPYYHQQERSQPLSFPPTTSYLPAFNPPPAPTYSATNYPHQQSGPSASLHAALREGTDSLPRTPALPRLPPLPRLHSTSAQQSSFGYIPNHFFYSPPQSPQEPATPSCTAESRPTQAIAGPSTADKSSAPSTACYPAASNSASHSAGPSTSAHQQSNFQSPAAQSHVNAAESSNMPSASASTSASAARKRSRQSISESPAPPAVKRRLNLSVEPIELVESDAEDEEIVELEPGTSLIAKQQEELVNKQREESSKITRMGDLNCMVCLEHFTNMTATHCGHIFCHECLTQALTASQRNSDHNYGTCPACRKPIKPKGKNQIIPLTLMKGKRK